MPLPSELVKKIRRIEIKSRRLVDTLFQRAYKSVFKGKGIEFSGVREYQYGDDVRSIDWKVTARMSKTYVKEFVEERGLTVLILFDASQSCEFGSAAIKKEQMVELCASLAFSAFRSNNRVGLIIFTDKIEKVIPPKKGRAQVYRIIREMLYHEPKSRGTNISEVLAYVSKVTKRRAIIFVVSDFFEQSHAKTVSEIRRLKNRNDVIAVKILDRRDLQLPDVGLIRAENPETGEQVLVDTSDEKIRERYSALALEKDEELKKNFKTLGVDLIAISTGESFAEPLIKFFKLREKRLFRTG